MKKLVQAFTPLPLIEDTEENHITNHIREDFTVTSDFSVHFGAYTYHFNNNGSTVLPKNIGYTYISGEKYSKVDILRMFGGDSLVQQFYKYLEANKPPQQTVRKGSASRLLRKIHNKRS